MVVAEHDTIEAGQCILGQYGEREVAGHQMGGDGVVAGTAIADRETRLHFTGHTDLLEADHAALILTDTQEENPGGAILADRELVGRDERHPAPGDEGRSEQVNNHGRNTASGRLTAKGGNGLGMGQEEGGLLPDECE